MGGRVQSTDHIYRHTQMDIVGKLDHIILYDSGRHHIHVLKMGHDKNTSQRLALQYDRLQSAVEEIKRSYTTTVSFINYKNILNYYLYDSKPTNCTTSDLSSL